MDRPIRIVFQSRVARATQRWLWVRDWGLSSNKREEPGNEAISFPEPAILGKEQSEGNEGSGIIRCRKPGIVAKIELRIHFNGQSESSLKRIIPEPSFPSKGSQARGTRLGTRLVVGFQTFSYPEPFLRAVRRGALAKSKTGNHKNMVKDIYVIRTITFVVANQMPI